MAHAEIKAKLFVILAHLCLSSLSNRHCFNHVPAQTTSINHGEWAEALWLLTMDIIRRQGTHCFHSVITAVTNVFTSFAVIIGHNYLWQVKPSQPRTNYITKSRSISALLQTVEQHTHKVRFTMMSLIGFQRQEFWESPPWSGKDDTHKSAQLSKWPGVVVTSCTALT